MTRSVRLLAAAVILLGGCGGGEPAGAPGTTTITGRGPDYTLTITVS